MDLATPTKEHTRLEAFAGSWIGEETIHPSQWEAVGGKAIGHVEARVDLSGFFLLTDYAQERDGRIVHRGHGVFGYDATEALYTLHWFDSMGFGAIVEPARGTFEDGALVLQQSGLFGHSRYVYRANGPNAYVMKLDVSVDGEAWQPLLEGTYTRQACP